MYQKPFYINTPVGNNEFSFKQRKNKELYVTNIEKINNYDEIELGDEIVFDDFDSDGKLSSNKGLKNFYKIRWKNKDIILFDNHNHAFYFWYEARKKGIIGDNNILFHIDEHSDLKDNNKILSKNVTSDLKEVFNFTNFSLNVGDYIIPAKNEGIIGDIIQIRNEGNLNDYLESYKNRYIKNDGSGVILNLDLDFFRRELDFTSYDLKKKVILDIAKNASIITVATSPFFIDQNLAIKVFKDIFG